MKNEHQKYRKSNVISFIPSGEYYYTKAMEATSSGELTKAHKYFKRAAELSPDDAEIFLQLGTLELDEQNYTSAHEALSQVLKLQPKNTEALFLLAETAGCMGLIQDSRTYAEQYLAIEPNGFYADEAREIIAFIEFEMSSLPEDEKNSTEEMREQEHARLLMEQSKFAEAIEVLENIIERKPEFWSGYNNLALAYFYIGEVEQARALLGQVLRANNGNLHALCNIAVIAYYEKDSETLEQMLAILRKIQPYEWEHRYKLGATLALIGEYELAFKWLRSMQRKGFEGDVGFYFWLSHAAYFSGHETMAKKSWQYLVELDPSKEGYEPWAFETDVTAEQMDKQKFTIDKLMSEYVSERLFGLFLLSKSPTRQEILAHPTWVDVERYGTFEKLYLAHILGHDFDDNGKAHAAFIRATEVPELMLEAHDNTFKVRIMPMFQLWFGLCEAALLQGYTFKNPKALAAANDYLFRSVHEDKVTKKEVATQYGIAVATLTKYTDELLAFLPNQE